MARSTFSYNVQRSYPYKWFTPVVIIGGSLLIVLFSFLNLGSSGYNLTTELTQNPNSTSSGSFYDQLPSFIASKLQRSCEPAIIPINSNIMTNNSALTYTLRSVVGADAQLQPSLSYQYNFLENCTVNTVIVFLEYSLSRTAAQYAARQFGANVQADITCSTQLASTGRTIVNLTALWDPFPSTVATYEAVFFPGRNKTASASMYWGESLLMLNWLKTTGDMLRTYKSEVLQPLLKAETTLVKSGLTLDVLDSSYYNASFRGISFHVTEPWLDFSETNWNWNFSDVTIRQLEEISFAADIWNGVDHLAKSFEATVLADLGQITTTPNILADAAMLQNFTSNFTNEWSIYSPPDSLFEIVAQSDYNSLKGSTGPLGIRPAVLGATYICNVPKQKPIGDLIIAILVADLVLLQTAWKIYCLIVGMVLRRTNKDADRCQGCLSNAEVMSVDGVEYQSISARPK
ncbi:hypothetical protein AMS68_005533 [Peltaster fructicola]|uniref:Uncharacterized protein n=1 Tax=Peltaster fructicola TaxID=286661 RepID=A0A6H0XZB3_9PEZI|nr:hypothetical protein AMS68_005533 [Peltaster fructicola]